MGYRDVLETTDLITDLRPEQFTLGHETWD